MFPAPSHRSLAPHTRWCKVLVCTLYYISNKTAWKTEAASHSVVLAAIRCSLTETTLWETGQSRGARSQKRVQTNKTQTEWRFWVGLRIAIREHRPSPKSLGMRRNANVYLRARARCITRALAGRGWPTRATDTGALTPLAQPGHTCAHSHIRSHTHLVVHWVQAAVRIVVVVDGVPYPCRVPAMSSAVVRQEWRGDT